MYAWHLPDLRTLFLSASARKAAVSMLSLFSPVYIFKTFSSLGFASSYSVMAAIAFYLIVFLAKLPTLLFSENLSQRLGFKNIIKLSGIPFIFFIPFMIYASRYPDFFWIAALLWGIHAGLFWWGYHGYFIKSGSKSHFGQSIAEINFLDTVIAIIFPLLAAFLISIFGFIYLYLFSGLLVLLSLFLLGKDHDKRQRRDITVDEVLGLIFSHKSVSLAYAGSSAQALLYSVAWPVFLYLFFQEVTKLGFVISVSALIASLFAIFVGGWVDKLRTGKIICFGIPLVFVSWIFKLLFRSTTIFILADSIWNFGERMVALPLNALTYQKAEGRGIGAAILFREINLMFGGILSLLLLLILLWLGFKLTSFLLLAAFFSLFPLISVLDKSLK